ncbi:hypothetical protein OIU81_36460 [Streptomyces sp. NBC_01454]|uniref:hypothetical protein n=1 Tax=Streptomyces sp. NBC_01454 TaxID=2975867 RepID=UPI002E35E2C9|nr:hypothetical protein [Streptomyces sp. NBC_01454]
MASPAFGIDDAAVVVAQGGGVAGVVPAKVPAANPSPSSSGHRHRPPAYARTWTPHPLPGLRSHHGYRVYLSPR